MPHHLPTLGAQVFIPSPFQNFISSLLFHPSFCPRCPTLHLLLAQLQHNSINYHTTLCSSTAASCTNEASAGRSLKGSQLKLGLVSDWFLSAAGLEATPVAKEKQPANSSTILLPTEPTELHLACCRINHHNRPSQYLLSCTSDLLPPPKLLLEAF